MKTRFSYQRNQALTLVELLVVIVVLIVLAAVFISNPNDGISHKATRINCVNNLKQVGLAYRIWAADHNDKYPMQVSIADTNGGTMELVATGNVVVTFQIMSNELNTPLLLYCTADINHSRATNFTTDFSAKNISYFVGADADQNHPQRIISGDDNFEISGVPIKSGLLEFSTNSNIAWASGRHVSYNSHFWTPPHDKFVGNIGLADGSVQMVTTRGLWQAIQNTGIATNRLAIP